MLVCWVAVLSWTVDTSPIPAEERAGHMRRLLAADSGTHVLQVEDFDGPWRSQTNIPGYLGAGFKTSNAQGVATSVMRGRTQVRTGGRFAVWARGYEGEGMDRSFSLTVAGQDLPPTHTRRDRTGFCWQRAGEVPLQPGTVEIVVHDRGDGFEVADAVLLTSDPTCDPDLQERERCVLRDRMAESRKIVDVVIERANASARAGHEQWLKVMSSHSDWDRAREKLRTQFRKALGLWPWPPRTPLNAQVLGETLRDGYKVQRLTFESRAGFVVTANVYVPEPSGSGQRWPAVLCPVGHWPHSKTEPVVQARCIGLAKLGFVVLTYDPFGQGERAVEGNGHDEYWRAALSGLSNMSFMIWDSVRALDYLLSLPCVDPARVACTGASGGGLNTLYLSAVDDRIKVSVPVVYLTSFEAFLGTRAGHCPCSHVPGLASFADMGDIAALIAPRPLLAMCARLDAQFTVAGAERAMDEALPAYQAYDAKENAKLLSFEGGHDYNKAMREALYGFVLKHLKGQGDGSPVAEPAMTTEPVDSSVLRCFPDGKLPPGGETVRSLGRKEAARLLGHLGARDSEVAKRRKALRRLLHWPTDTMAPASPDTTVRLDSSTEVEKVLLRAADGVALPALFFRHGSARRSVAVCGEAGMQALCSHPVVEQLHRAGLSVFLVDLRGWGETATDTHLLATDSMLLGDPLPAQRARDLAAAINYLRQRPDAHGPVGLLGLGVSGGMVSLLAAAAEGRFDAVAAPELPESLLGLMDTALPAEVVVPSLAAVADLTHLRATAGHQVYAGDRSADSIAAWFNRVLGGDRS